MSDVPRKFHPHAAAIPRPTFSALQSSPPGMLPLLLRSTPLPLHLLTALAAGCSPGVVRLSQLALPPGPSGAMLPSSPGAPLWAAFP